MGGTDRAVRKETLEFSVICYTGESGELKIDLLNSFWSLVHLFLLVSLLFPSFC